MKPKIGIQILFLLISLILIHAGEKQSNLPISREAVIIEYTSPSEVVIRATGYGISNRRFWVKSKELDLKANIDARRAALWYLIFGGTDPILKTKKEIENFKKIQNSFFSSDNIKQFIVWESETYNQRIKFDNGKKLKIVKTLKVNVKLLKDFLASNGIIESEKSIMEKAGLPQIMVVPEAKDTTTAIELLKKDPLLKKGAEAIEQSLTARGFEVIVPEQISSINNILLTRLSMVGESPDPAYLFALSIGSDVYITFNMTSSARYIGSTMVKKYAITCRAFETTTARLLGTEIGYSKERPARDAALIEEAVNNAIGKVLDRIIEYWKMDLKKGTQYRIIISCNDEPAKENSEEIFYIIRSLLKKMGNLKENSISDNIYDSMLWINSEAFAGAFDIYMHLKKKLATRGLTLDKVFLNRKLLVLKVGEN